jgi:hypothetical protein
MKLWSRGLGKQELKMDFMRYEIKREEQEIVISGRITDPVNWEFWIRFDEDDVPGLIRVAKNRGVLGMVLSHYFGKLNPFRRRKGAEEPEDAAKPAEAESPAAEPVASAAGSQDSASES